MAMSPVSKARALVREGLCASWDEAIHMLADMGDIDSREHELLLSANEAALVFGARALDEAAD